jgi:hypothetical protein
VRHRGHHVREHELHLARDEIRQRLNRALVGTCTMFTPVIDLNISPLMCDWMPLPPEPKLSWPGRVFASVTSSATLDTDGCTTSTWPAVATRSSV